MPSAPQPLEVHVAWHPGYGRGPELAEHLFRQLCADPDQPNTRGLGITVRFATSTVGSVPTSISFTADQTVVVVLVDDEMVVADGWDDLLEALFDQAGAADRIIPVALTPRSFNISPEVRHNQFLRLQGTADADLPMALVSAIMHDLCRLLVPDEDISVFVSHAKDDGVPIADVVRRHLSHDIGLTDFFDARDIEHGKSFKDEITAAIADSAVLLAVHTDSYASREWCRVEVLDAKRLRIPILVLAAVRDGEVRSFPYIGNVPVVRWTDEATLPRIVHALLREVLRRRWFPRHMETLALLSSRTIERDPFIYPPELLTALELRTEAAADGRDGTGQYLYPDPPLGTEELNLLTVFDETLVPITPTELLT